MISRAAAGRQPRRAGDWPAHARGHAARAPPADRSAPPPRDRGGCDRADCRGRVRAVAARLAVPYALRRSRYTSRQIRPDRIERKRRHPRAGSAAKPRTIAPRLSTRSRTPARRRLTRCARRLDPTRGTAIITEGLINYFDRATVAGDVAALRTRARAVPARHLPLATDPRRGQRPARRAARSRWLVGAFVRGRTHTTSRPTPRSERARRRPGSTPSRSIRATSDDELPISSCRAPATCEDCRGAQPRR